MSSKNIKTVAVHAGSRIRGSRAEGIAPPLHLAAVSYFDDAGALDRSLDGKDFVYARISSQNVVLLEEAVAALEGAEACVAFASGMAALRAVLDAQPLASGDCVVMPADGYGATRALFKSSLARRGIELHPLILSEPGTGGKHHQPPAFGSGLAGPERHLPPRRRSAGRRCHLRLAGSSAGPPIGRRLRGSIHH